MKQYILLSLCMIASGLFAQVKMEEVFVSPDSYNYQSVGNHGETFIIGGVCSPSEDMPLQMNMYKSIDAGASWNTIQSASVGSDNYLYITNPTFIDEDIIVASCSGRDGYYHDPTESQFIVKSIDGGDNWDVVYSHPSGHSFERIAGIDFFDGQHGMALGYFDKDDWFDINAWGVTTDDQGKTWTAIDFPDVLDEYKTIQDFCIVDYQTSYLVAEDAYPYDSIMQYYFYKSIDQGHTWTEVSQNLMPAPMDEFWGNANVSDIEFINENVGFMSIIEDYEKSVILKTVNGGVTWTEMPHPLDVANGYEDINVNKIHFINEQEGYAICGNYCNSTGCYRGYAVMYTIDAGLSWTVLDSDRWGRALVDMAYDETSGSGIAVGGTIQDSDGIAFKLSGSSVGTPDIFDDIEVSVGPNPSEGQIRFTNGLEVTLSLEIFGIDSKLIESTRLNPGVMVLSLERGQYLYKVQTTDGSGGSKSGILLVQY